MYSISFQELRTKTSFSLFFSSPLTCSCFLKFSYVLLKRLHFLGTNSAIYVLPIPNGQRNHVPSALCILNLWAHWCVLQVTFNNVTMTCTFHLRTVDPCRTTDLSLTCIVLVGSAHPLMSLNYHSRITAQPCVTNLTKKVFFMFS
jgi:hypothetical protein